MLAINFQQLVDRSIEKQLEQTFANLREPRPIFKNGKHPRSNFNENGKARGGDKLITYLYRIPFYSLYFLLNIIL